MEVALIPIWITSTASVVGVVYAIVRNGSRGKKQDAKLKEDLLNDINTIKTRLDDTRTGLTAIKQAVDEQRRNCSEISSTLTERVAANRRDVEDLKKRRQR
jgi:polyhydroxyalkanoate synthesis regulator phasin